MIPRVVESKLRVWDSLLLREICSEGVVVCFKEDGYRVWWHAVVAWLVNAMFVATRSGLSFERDFATSLGDHIYLPDREAWEDIRATAYTTLAHEMQHYRDWKRHGWWFRVSYVLLPWMRMRWELRAYRETIRAWWHAMGRPYPDEWKERIARSLCGPAYAWAGLDWRKPFRELVEYEQENFVVHTTRGGNR